MLKTIPPNESVVPLALHPSRSLVSGRAGLPSLACQGVFTVIACATTWPGAAWPGLVEAATFASKRASADKITGSGQILKSATAFFRRGTSDAGRELLTEDELAHYDTRAAELAPPDMLHWLHRP